MQNVSNLLYTVEQIREIEKIAVQEYGISIDVLMGRAGNAAFKALKKHFPKAKNITVVTGKGNNAGDGYVLAYLAKRAKLNVRVLYLVPPEKLSGAAFTAALKCKKLKIKIEEFSAQKLAKSDVIVDAILGTGVVGEVVTNFKDAICAINESKIPVLAIDLPSGICANTGQVLGAAIDAKLTVTFIAKKTGLFVGDARNFTGIIVCDDLNIDKKIFERVHADAKVLNFAEEIKLLPPRKRTAHKGDFGHVLVVGGDYGMGGAVRMAAEAALRVGAGLVSVATRAEQICALNAARPEIMAHVIEREDAFKLLLDRASVVVIGPGLGISDWSKMLFYAAISAQKPLVVDADALNILAQNPTMNDNWILTPHPGEAGRLLNITSKIVQNDRMLASQNLQKTYGGVCVLKGSGTLISAHEQMTRVCDYGNPGMASGGMGDILSGIIGGLVASHLKLFDAANLGVLLHATAGDIVANESGMRGMLALDLLSAVRKVMPFVN